MTDESTLSVKDMNGDYIGFIAQADADELVAQGFALNYGTKRKRHGIQLTVSLAKANGDTSEQKHSSSSPSRFTGVSFCHRVKVASEKVNSFEYRHKRMHVTESPVRSLLRMMTPPALETSTYIRRDSATAAQLASDASNETRRNARAIIQFPAAQRIQPVRRAA